MALRLTIDGVESARSVRARRPICCPDCQRPSRVRWVRVPKGDGREFRHRHCQACGARWVTVQEPEQFFRGEPAPSFVPVPQRACGRPGCLSRAQQGRLFCGPACAELVFVHLRLERLSARRPSGRPFFPEGTARVDF